MFEVGKRFAVFSIKKTEKYGTLWTRAGNAMVNKDGSMNIYLDVLPITGQLHVREAGEKRDAVAMPASSIDESAHVAMAGGH